MIFADFAKALGQFFDPRFLRVLLIGVALSLALLFGVYAGFVQILDWLTPETFTLPWVGEVTWVRDLLGWGSLALMIGLSVFLMVPVASAFTGLFLDAARAHAFGQFLRILRHVSAPGCGGTRHTAQSAVSRTLVPLR